jgi:pyridoxine 4-dehydrogenase
MNFTWRPTHTSDEQAFKALKTTIDAVPKDALAFINTGEFYAQDLGTANLELLNRFFISNPSYMERCFISVKGAFGKTLKPDSSDENLRKSVENINKVLGVRKMDLFEPARVDDTRPIEETMKSLMALRDEGHFKYIGLSEVSETTLRKALSIGPVAAVEEEYSPWSLDIESNGLLSTCKELDIPIIAYSPLGRGFLTGSLRKVEDIPEGDFRRTLDRFQVRFSHFRLLSTVLTGL